MKLQFPELQDMTLAEYALWGYEGTWSHAVKALASGEDDVLIMLDSVCKSDAIAFRGCARELGQLVSENSAALRDSIAFLLDIADALDEVIPAVREHRLEELPAPNVFRERAEQLNAEGGLEYRRTGRPSLEPIVA